MQYSGIYSNLLATIWLILEVTNLLPNAFGSKFVTSKISQIVACQFRNRHILARFSNFAGLAMSTTTGKRRSVQANYRL